MCTREGSSVDLVSLEQLEPGKAYAYKSEESEIEGSFKILGEGAMATVLFNIVRSCDEEGYAPIGVHTITLIGWILDTDDFISSLCLQPFSTTERFNFGQSNLLGLMLSGPALSPRPVLLGLNPEIEVTPQVEGPANERQDW